MENVQFVLSMWTSVKRFLSRFLLTQEKLEARAREGDDEALFLLADRYYRGKGRSRNHGKAAECMRKAAEQGHAKAQFYLGLFYKTGELDEFIEQSYEEAVSWFTKAAKQGEKGAKKALKELQEAEEKDIVVSCKRKAEQGDVDSQFELASMYRKGEGVEQDLVEAAKWYRKAAGQEHFSAQFYLGLMHQKGEGVEQDLVEAAKWYRKAAEQGGHAAAQFNLASMYRKGEGVEQDLAEAAMWFRKAADQGHAGAKEALKELESIKQ